MSQQKNNHFSRKIIAVLEIIATFARDYQINPIGEVLEWLKRHAWKACSRQNRLAGSNPVLSAQKKVLQNLQDFFCAVYSNNSSFSTDVFSPWQSIQASLNSAHLA